VRWNKHLQDLIRIRFNIEQAGKVKIIQVTCMNSSNSGSLNSISTTCHSGFPNPANLNTRHCSVKVGTVLGNHNFLLWPFGAFWLCTSSLPGTFKLFIVIIRAGVFIVVVTLKIIIRIVTTIIIRISP